ncbi:MAG: response regulator transcription factor [Microthrixaceae bacterium]
MTRLLLVEDDAAIVTPLQRALSREGFEVKHVERGADAIEASRAGDIDLVVLDLTLPDIDGLDVCRAIRELDSALPVIMLTARSDELDLVVGFDAGADDYMAKPFSIAELTARIRARLRLSDRTDEVLDVHGVRLDRESHRVWADGEELHLTPKEFELLALLMSEAGRVVTRQRILKTVWDEDYYAASRSLDVHVSALRKKLGDPPDEPQRISTLRGVGVRFEDPAYE